MLAVTDSVGLAPELLASLKAELEGLSILQDVIRWGFSQSPPSDVADVVIQDEFTHDVVLPWRHLYLVFDTT
ncbi:hypothetical protein [Hyalangium rubrum]|uniref:Uncharacterized protein n=1 Tax=Hyalangium rubrum TaxID=3103134 RepID=A0ABU5HHY5_9BACT|nr:hypothetical protein [Hyalangium sp. s54d21]MDY7232437.1 hypothetical protein [Hyalangium sp. s54d21]